MSNVVLLDRHKEESEPHTVGLWICMNCQHEHTAVTPVGVVEVECPSCKCIKAVHKNFCTHQQGDLCYTCSTCEGRLFEFRADYSALCAGCGTRHWPFSDENMDSA